MQSILQSLREGPQLKTHVAYNSKIDSRTIVKYLPLLIKLGLVTKKSSGRYSITKKGLAFLKDYAKLKEYDEL